MLIDFHTHTFPDKICERAIKTLEGNATRVSGHEVHACIGGDLPSLKRSMRDEGVDISVVMPIATNTHQSETINKYAAEITGKDGIISFGSLHPEQENALETVDKIAELGLLGIKLHPEYQGFYIDSEKSLRVLKRAEERGLLVMLHAGRDIGIEPPVHCAPERLLHTLSYVSGENIIAAHMGGWKLWDEVERCLVGTPIMLDTAYVSLDMSREQCERIIKAHGADKVLFGTDSPWERPRDTVAFIESLNLSEDEKERIYYKNALRLLKIDAAA